MSRPIRVVFVTPDLRAGGAERHIATVLPALDRYRFETRVVCLRGKGPLFGELAATAVQVDSLEVGQGRAALLRAVIGLTRELRRHRPQVVMTASFSAGVVGRLAARLAGVPAVITWKHNCGHLGRHGVTDRWGERVLGRFTSRYLGVCYGQVPYLVDYLRLDPAKVRVVHNSIPLPEPPVPAAVRAMREALDIPPLAPVVGLVSVLREEKDPATMLRAFRLVVEALPSAVLLVAGDGPLRPAMEALAGSLGLSARVRFLGHRSDVAALLGAVDVVALTSFTIECFPYAILEAMAAGKPAVCTAVGGLPEMVEDGSTGFLVPPRSPVLLA
ncbi:MAG: glycosyltransferase, partial [Mycobacteriales bacterium]